MGIFFKHIGLFEGIGGFGLAAKLMNWETAAWCEINPFCQRILKYHFPKSIAHEDIRETDFTIYRGTIDIITGGFPCQPFSQSGAQKGEDDERYLFPEMFRAIREIKAPWIVAENVYGITTRKFREVFEIICSSLEAEGYEVQPVIIPASAVGAPHERDRVWFVAYNSNAGFENMRQKWQNSIYRPGFITNPNTPGLSKRISRKLKGFQDQANTYQGSEFTRNNTKGCWDKFPTQSPICSRNDGISFGLDDITFPKWRNESIKGLGNAIVPQVAVQIFEAIQTAALADEARWQKILKICPQPSINSTETACI